MKKLPAHLLLAGGIFVLGLVFFNLIIGFVGIDSMEELDTDKNNSNKIEEVRVKTNPKTNPKNEQEDKKATQVSVISANRGHVENMPDCIPFSELESQLPEEMYLEFLNDNMLMLDTVDEYLTSLSNEELELEFRAGNFQAAFVIGMNLMFNSYNTRETHPSLPGQQGVYKPNRRTKLNKKKLSRGREWLWLAAINGAGTALAEIAGSYELESQLIESTFDEQSEDIELEVLQNRLVTKALAFHMLYLRVNPFIVKLGYVDDEHYYERFEKHPLREKHQILKELNQKWDIARTEMNKSQEIEIKYYDELKEHLGDIHSICG